ncbi:MAG: ABC transporter permease [Actinobacteria bacterium]|nr:ABC transporter permease [Cyanobacteriota bacterium]MCL5771147.1 ABC transporter permease [Actinomycetota bacterium]
MGRTSLFSGWLRKSISTVMPIIVVIVVIGVFQLVNPTFLSYQGIITLIYSSAYFLVAACGLTFVIMMGSFDFSVISLLKLSAIICVLYIDKIGFMVIPIALLICVGFGFVNGLLFAKFKVPSFMVTLGISIVVEGIALYLSKGFLNIMYNKAFMAISTTFIAGLPSILYWAIGTWSICTFIAIRMPFGRRTYAIGGNSIAAGLSGINIERQRIYVFMLSGFLSGLAGILYMAQMGGGSTNIGVNMTIPLFASVVAGGTALTGGVGGPHRTLLGVIIITWIQAGLLMIGMGLNMQFVVIGLIAIVMTIATTDRRRTKIIK